EIRRGRQIFEIRGDPRCYGAKSLARPWMARRARPALSSGTSKPRGRPGRIAGETMKRPYRSALVATLAPAVLLAATFTAHAAQPSSATRWSDPATWPNRKVPAAGEKVTIAKDKEVILDVSTPALAGVSIDGKLTFADNRDVELTTEWIMLHGELQIGTE